MKYIRLTVFVIFSGLMVGTLSSQKRNVPAAKDLMTYKLPRNVIYKKGWIDFNKNGVMDIYENPNAPLEQRIEDLLSQMNVEEKTCQMVTLYGYKRVLADDLPTPEWKKKLWKDGMGAIDEHLNGFQQWGVAAIGQSFCLAGLPACLGL